jgi:hypothetical protein
MLGPSNASSVQKHSKCCTAFKNMWCCTQEKYLKTQNTFTQTQSPNNIW